METLDNQLKKLHTSVETLVLHRRGMSTCVCECVCVIIPVTPLYLAAANGRLQSRASSMSCRMEIPSGFFSGRLLRILLTSETRVSRATCNIHMVPWSSEINMVFIQHRKTQMIAL